MHPSLRLLGLAGMLGSPFLWLQTQVYQENMRNTSLTGVYDLLYMLGWSCSIIGLIRLQAAGEKSFGKRVLYIQLALLGVANIWNIWVIVDPLNSSVLFKILDMFWPISNLFMLVTGIAVVIAKKLPGFARWAPFLAGLWLPVTMLSGMLLQGNELSYYIMNIYSLVSFFMLGLMIFWQKEPVYQQQAPTGSQEY